MLCACNGSTAPESAPPGAQFSTESVPLSVSSTYGSGNLGLWQTDEFGLPYFRYDLDHVNDPRGAQAELLVDARQAQHQLGNDHINAFAVNDGYTVLWSQARMPQWANEWEPNYNEWTGGWGYVHTGDGPPISTFWLDRPADAQTERDFGLGYYRRSLHSDSLDIREETYAPFGDDPLLLHDVTIRNDGVRERNVTWFEYWDVNPYNRAMLHNRGIAAPRYDADTQTLTVRQLPDLDTDPLTIFASALDAPVDGFETSQIAFFGVVPSRATPAAVLADRATNSIALPALLGTHNQTVMVFRSPAVLAPGQSVTLRYAYGMAKDAQVPELVARYRAAHDPLRTSEKAWARWVPHADFGPNNVHVARELAWAAYLLRSATVYEELCGAHTITQGGYYQYSLGYNLGYRSWLHYLFPMVYAEPQIAREILRYSIRLQPELGGGFVPYGTGPLCIRFDLGTSNDLDFWLLLGAADYGLGTRDVAFFDEPMTFYDTRREVSAWDHIKLSFRHQESMKGPNGGYIMGATGDWSDFATPLGPMTESMLVAQQLAYAYPKLAEVADLRGDAAFAAQLRAGAAELHDMLADQWTGLGWYSRGYFGFTQIGAGVPYGEPQPWAILAGIPTPERAATLVANIRRFLTGIGAPGGPSPIGSGMSPATGDPDITERAPGILPDVVSDPIGLGLSKVPGAPLAGAAVYPGGVWFDVNGWLTWALASLDGVVPNARAYAWDEYTRNLLSAHATAYPDHWAGTINADDACNAWYSATPEHCGIGIPTWSGSITEQPTWVVMDSLRLAGLTADRDGFRIAPHFPFGDFALAFPRVGIERRGSRMRGYFQLEADGPVRIAVRLPDGVTTASARVDGASVSVNRVDSDAQFMLPARAGQVMSWEVQW
jgi:hypothetical protein